MAAFTTNLTLGAGSYVSNTEIGETASIAGMRTRGNSLAQLVSDGVDTLLVGDQHATIKDDAMVYDLTVNGVNRLRFEGFTTFELGEGNDVLDLTVQPRNVGSAWSAAITANGGAGDDVIWSGSGADTLNGDAGADRIWGGAGNDTIGGGDDADVLRGAAGLDILNGGAGDDQLFGGNDNDTLNGDAGADTLRGEGGNDVLNGGTEDDQLFGGDGNDALNGGDGADVIRGDAGNDTIDAGAGNDLIYGGTDGGALTNIPAFASPAVTSLNGGDRIRGGGGADKFVWRTGDGADGIIDFVDGTDKLLIQGTATFFFNHAAFSLGGSNFAANSSTVVSVGGASRLLIAGVKYNPFPVTFTLEGTETIDGITFNVYG